MKKVYPERRVFMKKLTAIFLCALTVVFCFSSCARSEAVKALEEKIKSVTEVNLETEQIIAQIEDAYKALSEEEQQKVKNYDDFEVIKADFEELKKFSEDAENLKAVYSKIFEEYGSSAEEILEPFAELSEKYNSCKDSLKTAYGEIFEDISLENEKYLSIADEATASAATYVKGLYAVNDGKEINVKHIGCIAQTSEEINYFLFAAVYDDGEEADKKVYAVARYTGTPAIETMTTFADNFYSAAPVTEKTDPLENANVELDLEAVLEAAKK